MAVTYRFVDSGASGTNSGLNWTDAWTSIASAKAVAADTVVLIKGGTTYDTEDAATDAILDLVGCAGTLDAPVVFQGDDASGGAGPGNPAEWELDADANNLNYCVKNNNSYVVFKNCEAWGANISAFYELTEDRRMYYRCKIHDNTSYNLRGDDGVHLVLCEIYNSGYGYEGDNKTFFVACEFYNHTINDVSCDTGISFANIVHNSNDVVHFEFKAGTYHQLHANNTFDGHNAGTGLLIKATNVDFPEVINNIFYDLTTGLDGDASILGAEHSLLFNLFNSNTNDVSADFGSTGMEPQTGAPAFTGEGVGDYTLADGSPAKDNGLDAAQIGTT